MEGKFKHVDIVRGLLKQIKGCKPSHIRANFRMIMIPYITQYQNAVVLCVYALLRSQHRHYFQSKSCTVPQPKVGRDEKSTSRFRLLASLSVFGSPSTQSESCLLLGYGIRDTDHRMANASPDPSPSTSTLADLCLASTQHPIFIFLSPYSNFRTV